MLVTCTFTKGDGYELAYIVDHGERSGFDGPWWKFEATSRKRACETMTKKDRGKTPKQGEGRLGMKGQRVERTSFLTYWIESLPLPPRDMLEKAFGDSGPRN